MGEGESVATERPFHNMNAVERTRAKLRTWISDCLRLPKAENMLSDITCVVKFDVYLVCLSLFLVEEHTDRYEVL